MTTATGLTVKILPNDKGTPPGKLAEAELHFTWPGEPHPAVLAISYSEQQPEARAIQAAVQLAMALDGLKLIGFAIWERHNGQRNVTFPARQYSVNGERRSFALLRPLTDVGAQNRFRDLILAAYAEHERAQQAPTEPPPVSDDLFGSEANVERFFQQPREAREPKNL